MKKSKAENRERVNPPASWVKFVPKPPTMSGRRMARRRYPSEQAEVIDRQGRLQMAKEEIRKYFHAGRVELDLQLAIVEDLLAEIEEELAEHNIFGEER